MPLQLQPMSGTLPGRSIYAAKCPSGILITYHEMSATINKCQVSYLEMLGTYLIAGIHELQQVYT